MSDDTIRLNIQGLIQALGGLDNVSQVKAVAETRLRVIVVDEAAVNDDGLQSAGVHGIMRLPNRTLHLLVGLEAYQYAVEMQRQLVQV
jgi:PTS system glucose-specific IIC component